MQDWFDNLGPIFLPDLVNRQHPLNQGRTNWWLVLPGLDGGRLWYDLVGKNSGVLTSMGNASNGWRGSARPGGWGTILCDGTAGYVNCGNPVAFSPLGITVSIWANARAWTTSGFNDIFGRTSAVAPYGGFWLRFASPSSMSWAMTPTGGSYLEITTPAPAINSWHQYTGTWDGVSMRLYIDGVLKVGPTTNSGSSVRDNGSSIYIGASSGFSGRMFNGQVDSAEIYGRALSATEIWELYCLSRQGYPGILNTPVPALWPTAGTGPPPTIVAWPAAILGHL